MALDERFIPLNSLNDFYINKDDALPLANGTIEFYRDTSRSTPKPVFELVSAGGEYDYVELENPISLNSVGTVQNAGGNNVIMYAFPFETDPITSRLELDLYFLVAKDSLGNVQWTREAIPNLTSATDPTNDDEVNDGNQLANPQFTRYNLNEGLITLTLSGSQTVFPIAPDWDLVASGTGTIILERIAVSGNEAIPTFPAYYLKITVNLGITNPFLRQRLNKNSGLWSGNFVAGFIMARALGTSNSLTMKYRDSSGTNSNITIFSASLDTDWNRYGGSVELSNSGNTQSGDDAHVDITIELSPGQVTEVTSLQVIVSDSSIGDTLAYTKRTANREQALMGDYFIPRLEFKPIPSLLVGWDFPLNPTQFGESGSVTGDIATCIWDQTILQTVAGLTVDLSRNPKTNGLNLVHKQPDLPYALIQYLDKADARVFIESTLSVNVHAYTVDATNSAANTAIKIKIFANPDSNKFPILPVSLVNLANDGEATLKPQSVTDGWVEISRNNLPQAEGELTPLAGEQVNSGHDLGFNNWLIDDDSDVVTGIQGIAVVVSFRPADSVDDYGTSIDSISVVPGDIPTRPAPLSSALTLKACERYFQSSFVPGRVPATQQGAGNASFRMLGIPNQGVPVGNVPGPIVNFSVKMRSTNPTIVFFNPINNNAQIVLETGIDFGGSFVAFKSATMFVPRGTIPSGTVREELCLLSWTADARLGFV